MDVLALFKDVLLVLAGGIVTFIVTVAANRVQARKPELVWRLLPPTTFPSQEMSSFNLVVENTGSKDAEEVRILVDFPEGASINSFEIQVSEKATIYQILDTGKKGEIAVVFPKFYKGLECVFAFLAKRIDPKGIGVSIVGSDVVGQKKELEASRQRRLRRTELRLNLLFASAVVLVVLLMGYVALLSTAYSNYVQSIDIGDLYMKTGYTELAISTYEELARYWWFPSDAQLYYKLASAYASSNNVQAAVYYLRKAAQAKVEILGIVTTDKDFDSIRSDPEFVSFMKESK